MPVGLDNGMETALAVHERLDDPRPQPELMPTPSDPWHEAMLRGDFEAAWRISDRTLAARSASASRQAERPRHWQQIWRGQSLTEKRVLVRCYRGLGDTLQFARFLVPLRQIAAHVHVWTQPALLSLMSRVAGVDEVSPLHDGEPDVRYDVDIECMEIAHALRVTLDTLPRQVPYVFARRGCAHADGFSPQADRFNVGVAWQSGGWDERRSLPPEALTPLANIPGVRLHALQRGPAPRRRTPRPCFDISHADIEIAAARMAALDLIVSPDTMIAHLAGALGLPVYTLLHAESDWRWLTDRADSPWYPTMRLFRQRSPGDWPPVIAEVSAALKAAAEAKRGGVAKARPERTHDFGVWPPSRRATPEAGQGSRGAR